MELPAYPGFIKKAAEESNKTALTSFQNAMAVEQVHYSLYVEALNAVKGGADASDKKMLVCSVCGNTVLDGVPDKCPVCGAAGEKFFEVE